MKRRQFIVMLGGVVAAWPRLSLAERAGKTAWRIGILLFGTPDTDPNVAAFRRGLRDFGYIESQNIALEYRYAEGKSERLRGLANELVAIKPDVIFALGGDVAPLVRAASSTIPIVMAVSNDPVESGLVASLARPGGNITGVTFVSSDLAAKRLQFLCEIAPDLSRVAVLWNPDHIDPEYRETQVAAKTLGVQVQSLEVRTGQELMTTNRLRIIQFSGQHRLLLASGWGSWAREGALLSYGPDLDAITRRAAAYVDKILRGESPAVLPVEQPTTFQLLINGKTAKTLGLAIPERLTALADEVIE